MKGSYLHEFGIDQRTEGLYIIQVSSKWCTSCKSLTFILEKLKFEGLIDFINVDIDQFPSLCQKFKITAVPSLLFFKNGKLLNKNVQINEYYFVKDGLMIGISCESILKEIIWKLEQ